MKIMLDAGHGPNTPGKRSPDGMREFEFNSAVARAMKKELETFQGVTVYLAHENNRDVPLKERTDKANRLGVDVYISLHANALAGKMGSHGGIETYVYTSKPREAVALATQVQNDLINATGLRNRGVKTANFHVLRETRMTAILIEHGFMDSTTDLPKLKSADFRNLCGKTNANAVAKFYKLKKKAKPAKKVDKPVIKKTNEPSAWAKKDVEEMVKLGVTDGTNLHEPATRQQVIVMLNRLRKLK